MNKEIKVKNNSFLDAYLDAYFFGYLSLKWRRLIRTIFILSSLGYSLAGIIALIDEGEPSIVLVIAVGLLAILFVAALFSYLLEPFAKGNKKTN